MAMETSLETMPKMDDLAAAFAASVTMSGSSSNSNNSLPAPHLPAAASTSTSTSMSTEMKMVHHMEDLVAAFAAASVSLAAPPPNTAPPTAPSHAATTTTEEDDREPAKGEEACVLRVRFPDGRVACRSFGAGRPVAALFRYSRSALLGGYGGAGRRAFRIVKLAGGSSDEVRAGSASFRDLGLHHCTLHVVLA